MTWKTQLWVVVHLCLGVCTRVRCDVLLTKTNGSQHTQAIFWWKAGGEQRLQDIVGERQRDHSLVGRVDDKHSDPQPQEPAQKEGIVMKEL